MDLAPSVSIPRLTTERLLLRELRPGDFEAYAENMADPLTREHLPGIVDRRTAWRMFAAATGNWLLFGTGWWIVELRETGTAVGIVGAFFRETGPDLEVGWTIYPTFWRRGYAREAALAAVRFARERLDPPRVIAHISPTNAASIGVARGLGMRHERDVELYGETVGLYVVER